MNVRLRALAILNHKNIEVSFELWDQICPNIFMPSASDDICGSLSTDNRSVTNTLNGIATEMDCALGEADVVLTNPPFATIKGMPTDQKDFMKKNYPDANCDMCASFFYAIYRMLKPSGACGIVSQNSWMHLKTFQKMRKRITSQYCIHKIVNLGSGAFRDLSGEKSNISLLILGKEMNPDNMVEVLKLDELSLQEKIRAVSGTSNYSRIAQKEIDGVNGYDFSEKGTLNHFGFSKLLYKDIAVPMQGTSTGNAKELVGFFWEHFGDPEWVRVSNGGGYCRWQGLNDSVVKWGENGEYIRAQKGSALRNVKYFPVTQMVFSDTGTAGLNVRVLLDNQIFIAPNNLEYDSSFIGKMSNDLETAAWGMFNEDIMNELLKLQIEGKIDRYILKEYNVSKENEAQLSCCVGECAYFINGATDVDLGKLDRYIAKLLDASCTLKRTRTSKSSLGCDGMIEYAAKDLCINPEIIVRKIQEDPSVMKRVLKKYKMMILHNTVLDYLGYNTSDGVTVSSCRADEVIKFLTNKFGDRFEYGTWLEEAFNLIHREIFKEIPYLVYENGAIHKHDNPIAG